MSVYLPLFPLNLTVFPGEMLKLYIFEPRYKQLVNECLEANETFGIPAVVEQELAGFITEVEVVSLDKVFPDGEMNITTLGKRRARLLNFDQKVDGKLYPGGQIEWLPEHEGVDIVLQSEVFELMQELHDALGIQKEVVNSPQDVESFLIAQHIGLNLKQKIHLLSIDSEVNRMDFIKTHLYEIIPIVRETERLKSKARLNGHYKNMIPPDIT